MSHLLSLSALHAAAPGVLDIVFGADGEFEGAPRWVGPVLTPHGYRHSLRGVTILSRPDLEGGVLISGIGDWTYLSAACALDCRIPSVAARLAGLCKRAAGRNLSLAEDGCIAAAFYAHFEAWTATDAARLASLTLALAPKIAALGGSRV